MTTDYLREPCGEDIDPPAFEQPRFWSNPDLREPHTVIAAVLTTPTTVDLARLLATYGLARVSAVRATAEADMSPSQRAWLTELWAPVVQGALDAAR